MHHITSPTPRYDIYLWIINAKSFLYVRFGMILPARRCEETIVGIPMPHRSKWTDVIQEPTIAFNHQISHIWGKGIWARMWESIWGAKKQRYRWIRKNIESKKHHMEIGGSYFGNLPQRARSLTLSSTMLFCICTSLVKFLFYSIALLVCCSSQ